MAPMRRFGTDTSMGVQQQADHAAMVWHGIGRSSDAIKPEIPAALFQNSAGAVTAVVGSGIGCITREGVHLDDWMVPSIH